MKIKIEVSETFVAKLQEAGFTIKQIEAEAKDITEFYLLDVGHDDHYMEELIEDLKGLNDEQ